MLAAALLALAPQAAPTPSDGGLVERRLAAMGTWLEVTVQAADRATALAASEAAVRAIEACEARLSTWREDSELARLNAAPLADWRELSPELADELERARALWQATEGAFDPGLGALVEAWGLRSGGRQPAAEELAEALGARGFAGFTLEGRRAMRHHPQARIEEGGFGKGLGLDQALRALRAAGGRVARLDLGGQVLVHGAEQAIELADPDQRERALLALTLDSGSLATSGNSERGIVVDGERRGHLLDPRSGAPAPDFGSLTVWAADAFTADALSTGLYVLGPERALAWQAAARAGGPRPEGPACELLLLLRTERGPRAVVTAGLRPRVRALVPGLEIELAPHPSHSLFTRK
ncbi:MAG TPA: FAD:protein FMN transferase [Planctomycetota bacterium]